MQQFKPDTVITVQQAERRNKYCNEENKPKFENTLQLQVQPHFRSSVDHEANHTSGQHPVMRTVTEIVTRHLMIIDKDS